VRAPDLQPLAARPSLAALGSGRPQLLLGLAGDGQLDLAQFDGPAADASRCSLMESGSADATLHFQGFGWLACARTGVERYATEVAGLGGTT
jgi:hypothetical protein